MCLQGLNVSSNMFLRRNGVKKPLNWCFNWPENMTPPKCGSCSGHEDSWQCLRLQPAFAFGSIFDLLAPFLCTSHTWSCDHCHQFAQLFGLQCAWGNGMLRGKCWRSFSRGDRPRLHDMKVWIPAVVPQTIHSDESSGIGDGLQVNVGRIGAQLLHISDWVKFVDVLQSDEVVSPVHQDTSSTRLICGSLFPSRPKPEWHEPNHKKYQQQQSYPIKICRTPISNNFYICFIWIHQFSTVFFFSGERWKPGARAYLKQQDQGRARARGQ